MPAIAGIHDRALACDAATMPQKPLEFCAWGADIRRRPPSLSASLGAIEPRLH